MNARTPYRTQTNGFHYVPLTISSASQLRPRRIDSHADDFLDRPNSQPRELELESSPVGWSVKNAIHHQRGVRLFLERGRTYWRIILHRLNLRHHKRVNHSRDCEIPEIPGHAELLTYVDTNREGRRYVSRHDVSCRGSSRLPLPRDKLPSNVGG